MNYRRIHVWTGPLGQTEGLLRSLTSLPGAGGLAEPFSSEFVRLTGAKEAAPFLTKSVSTWTELLVLRSPAAHALGIDLRNFAEDLHLFFLQHPDERLPALTQAVGDPDWQERAYTWQEKLLNRFQDLGADCMVLEANHWRRAPMDVLDTIARRLGVSVGDFRPSFPPSAHPSRSEAWLPFGPGTELRDTCLHSYRRMSLQAIQDFPIRESEELSAR